MALGKARIPDEFKDEDKWLRFFSKRQVIVTVAFLVVGIILSIIFFQIGIPFIGLSIIVLFTFVGFAIVTFKVPDSKYLFCGGSYLYVLLARIIRKRLPWNRKLYVKNVRSNI